MPLVVLDPGHGGRDPGTSNNGYEEKTLVLSTCLLLRDALERCGCRVIMTRQTDTLPDPNGTIAEDLTYRATLANTAHADLFVAWHVDSATNADVNGVAIWIYPAARGTTTDTWAQKIVDHIAAASGQKNRGVYLGDFAVLRETTMPAVLVEAGFLTNVNEAKQLAAANFQRQQAEGAARGICSIFNMTYVPTTAPTPSQPTPFQPKPVPPTPPANTSEQVPSWAAEAVSKMMAWNIMTGYPDGTWRPHDPVSRAEMAVALDRFYQFIKNGNGGA